MKVVVRAETVDDLALVREVNVEAFESKTEADLVDRLRGVARPVVSLVATVDGAIAGHILFSPVTLANHEDLNLMGLGPMAVLPKHQRRGIGSALVREGLGRCVQLGRSACVVLGHRDFYPRFGFVPASRFGISCKWDVPDEVFMALELTRGVLRGRSGMIRYHEAFG